MLPDSRAETILARLNNQADPTRLAGMARYGIHTTQALGLSMPQIRQAAKEIGKDHALALELWQTGIHEARILAGLIADPSQVDERQMDSWVADFNSWDVCDQVCSSLFDRTPYAWDKAVEWSHREQEFVRRAGFVLMAALAVHNKRAVDEQFETFFPLIMTYSRDERNFVKKAVNWALRQIGKRNQFLNLRAIEVAQDIQHIDSRAARWIAADALRELTSPALQAKLAK